MLRSPLRLALAACAVAAASCTSIPWLRSGPSVHDHDLAVWQAYLEADEAEARWLEIGWIPTLAEGLQRADELDRPVLLWVMNGHPLGCT